MEKLCQIRDLYRAIYEFELEFEKKFGIGLNEGMLLCCLYKAEVLSSGKIAESLSLTCSNTSKVIRSLEKKGFIDRELGEQDKRQMNFRLTESGKELITSIRDEQIDLPEMLEAVIK